MDIRKVKKLIELLEESNLNEIEVSQGEESVRISKSSGEIKVLKDDDYVTMPGWDQSTFGIDDYSKLPINAIKYIEFLEEELNVGISIISTGPKRNQTIFKS